MSSNVPISQTSKTAPTPVNTPLTTGVLSAGLSRPTVPDVTEEDAEEISTDRLDALPAGARALLSGLVQDKIAGLIGRSSGYIEALPVPVKKNVEALKGVDTKYLEIYKEYKKELLQLEVKYAAKYQPLFDRRAAIVNGTAAPTAEELAAGAEVSVKDNEGDDEYKPLPADVEPAKEGIPDFWLTALRNHVGISDLITERDAPCLSHLTDVRCVLINEDAKKGYRLEFAFSKNDFFDNELLTKTYYYQDELDYAGDYVYDKSEGCEIKWKDDKDLTKSYEIKKQRNKNTNRTRLVRKAHPAESFFNFFAPPTPPDEEAIEAGDVDEEELEELEQRLEMDYQIGEDLKERVIPRAIDFFTGKALDYEELEDDDDDEDFEDVDDDEDDDDSEVSRLLQSFLSVLVDLLCGCPAWLVLVPRRWTPRAQHLSDSRHKTQACRCRCAAFSALHARLPA
ncbi:NAP-domain-containing protein [Auricularia subglabra TFB-10046 SS5]|nr:NAP-domain-containing protein [Auricularia subglabra TFB-10046 SS5]